jgi:exo-beta-1,3-glucanase (GH17 family)
MVMQLVKYESLRQAKTIKIALQVNRQTKRPDHVSIQLGNEIEFVFRSPAQLDEIIGGLQQARAKIAGDEIKIRRH